MAACVHARARALAPRSPSHPLLLLFTPRSPVVFDGELTTPGKLCFNDPDAFYHYELRSDGFLAFKPQHRALPSARCYLDVAYFRHGDWGRDGAADICIAAREGEDVEALYFETSEATNNARIVRELMREATTGRLLAVGAQVWTMSKPVRAGDNLMLEWGPQSYAIQPGPVQLRM